MVVNLIGVNNLVILALSYFAVIVYVARVPSMGPLSHEMEKIRVAPFVQQTFYILSFILVLRLIFRFDWSYFLALVHFSVIYAAILIPLVYMSKNIVKVSTYEGYLELRKMRPSSTEAFITIKKFWALALFWIISLVLFIYFMIHDPSLPLICWIFTFYSLASAFIIVALAHSLISHIMQSKYVIIKTSNGKQHEGFLVCKDNDIYNIKTDKGDQLIPSRQIEEILIKEHPRENSLD